MARATYAGKSLIDAIRVSIPTFATEDATKVLEGITSAAELSGDEEIKKFWSGIVKAVQYYNENPLTKEDLDKIGLHDAEIAKITATIAKINAKVLAEYQEPSQAAMQAGDMITFMQLAAKMQATSLKRTEKQRKAIETEQKLIVSIRNAQLTGAANCFAAEIDVHDGTSENTGGGGKYQFENTRFYIKSTRVRADSGEQLSWALEMQVDTRTRQVFARPIGDGWKIAKDWFFLGFYRDIAGKNKIGSRKRLCEMNYTSITVFTEKKPGTVEDARKAFVVVMDRAELGNMDAKYSGGSDYCLRVVEEYQSNAEDAGHQILATQLADPGWDKLEEQKAMVNGEIDKELAKSDETVADTANGDETNEETADSGEIAEEKAA